MQAAKDLNVLRFIHTSTSEVYGIAQFVPITEDHPIKGQSPYSATKIAADQLALSFYSSFNIPVCVLRPFNTYGPRQSNRAVIPTIITQLGSKEGNLKLGSTHPTRDFNYVSDICRGFLAALLSQNIEGEVINLCSNYEISILETVQILENIINSKLEIKSDKKRIRPIKSEVNRLWGDNSKAKKFLNWKPEYNGKDGFRRGLIETVEWFKTNNYFLSTKTKNYIL